jgi:hypothetical protein
MNPSLSRMMPATLQVYNLPPVNQGVSIFKIHLQGNSAINRNGSTKTRAPIPPSKEGKERMD